MTNLPWSRCQVSSVTKGGAPLVPFLEGALRRAAQRASWGSWAAQGALRVTKCARSPLEKPGGPAGRCGLRGQAAVDYALAAKPRRSSPPRTPWAAPSRPARRTSCRRTCADDARQVARRAATRSGARALAGGGQRAWPRAHVWSSWSLVSQVKLSWTSSPAHASSWSTPSTGAALAIALRGWTRRTRGSERSPRKTG